MNIDIRTKKRRNTIKRIKTIPSDLSSEESHDSDITPELELELKERELELKLFDSQASKEGRGFAPKINNKT